MRLSTFTRPIEGWIVNHPAVFAGLIIYSYYFTTTLDFFSDFFLDAGGRELDFWDYVAQFDALPVMWLLAYTFVRLLNFRERMHEEEKKVMEQRRLLDIQTTKIATLREVTVALMDKINNPVTVIMMYLRRLKGKIYRRGDAHSDYETIRKAANQISNTLKEVSTMDEYKILETPYGKVLDI